MLHKRIILRLCLLAFTGISCGLFARIVVPTPTETTQPELYSLDDALTLALRTILAESPETITPIPATNTLVSLTSTPVPVDLGTTSTFTILGEHRVVAGQTISCIGRGYRVSPKAIADANGIDLLSELKAGQSLKIPAVQWTTISAGPICSPQFTPPNWDGGATAQSQPTKKQQEAEASEPPVSNATEPSVSDATEPPVSDATEPPVSNVTEPPVVVVPRPCPPFCIVRPTIIIIIPPTTEDPGATQPPPVEESAEPPPQS
jgi:LysM repeat protein